MSRAALLAAALAAAAPAFAANPDYSGTYDCQGDDAKEGKYTGTVTLEHVAEQDSGPYVAYRFTLQVPGYGTYRGQAAAHGAQVAIHFALENPATKDYGTGIAAFQRGRNGKWSFSKYYYEPEFKGGNHGIERCTQR